MSDVIQDKNSEEAEPQNSEIKPKIICLSSMELQQIIVIAIVCLCTIWISIRIFQYFKRIKNNSNPCECCSSDCAMKSMQNKPKYGCEKNAEKVRKN